MVAPDASQVFRRSVSCFWRSLALGVLYGYWRFVAIATMRELLLHLEARAAIRKHEQDATATIQIKTITQDHLYAV